MQEAMNRISTLLTLRSPVPNCRRRTASPRPVLGVKLGSNYRNRAALMIGGLRKNVMKLFSFGAASQRRQPPKTDPRVLSPVRGRGIKRGAAGPCTHRANHPKMPLRRDERRRIRANWRRAGFDRRLECRLPVSSMQDATREKTAACPMPK